MVRTDVASLKCTAGGLAAGGPCLGIYRRQDRRWYKTLLLAVFVPAISLAQNAENGKRIFVRDGCYECHGYAGQGTIAGARLAPPVLNAQGMIRYVRRPAGAMPAFTDKVLSDQEVNDIYAYLKTIPAPKPVKDIPLLNQIK
jgi:mono/diheme cytochrome c family protein